MYEFQLHFTQIILIAFYAAGLLTALVVTLLSCLFARRRGDHARTGIPWFKAAAVLSSVYVAVIPLINLRGIFHPHTDV